MDKEEVSRRVTAMIVDHLGVAERDVQADVLLVPEDYNWRGRHARGTRGLDDLGCDSLDVVELVMAAEEEFRIEIPDDEAERLNTATVGEFVGLVHARMAEAA